MPPLYSAVIRVGSDDQEEPDPTERREEELMDYDEIEGKVSKGSGELLELKLAFKQLLARVDRHGLAIQALKSMLLSRGGFDEDEFLQHLKAAAAEKVDAQTCKKCGRALNSKHNRCMYCGEERPPQAL